MATMTWPDFKITHKHSSSGWKTWTWPASNLGERYVYVGNKCRPVLKFTTPPAASIKQGKLFLKIPWHRHNTTAYSSTGTMYLKLSTDESSAKSALPNSSNHDAYFSCATASTDSKETHLATVEFSNLEPSKTYYVTFYGASDINYINIGANTSNNENNYDFEIYTPVGEPNIEIIDNYNNTFTIIVNPGAAGENNPVIGLDKVSWVYPGGVSTLLSASSNPLTFRVPLIKNNNSTVAISVTACTVGTHNSTFSTVTKNISQYIAPPAPGKPVLIYYKNRLTIKEPWTFNFNNIQAANSTSNICGYIGRLYVNSTETVALGISYTAGNDQVNIAITDPSVYGIKPGDKITFTIQAFTQYGANNDGARLLGPATSSDEYIVQSAGIVRVKVDNEYKEGQVWIKADGIWREADTVFVKAGNAWKESK